MSTTDKNVEEKIKNFEEKLGCKIPEGYCVCLLDDGNFGFLDKGVKTNEEYEKFKLAMFLRGYGGVERKTVINSCTGNYVKL
jgi:hypothetical protein